MFIAKLVASVLANLLIFGASLFLAAGTWDWWRAWVLIGAVFAGTLGSIAGLARVRRDLLEERMKAPIQKGQPLADKIVTLLLLATFLGLLVFTALDVFRFHVLGQPGALVASVGLVMMIAGWWLAYLAMRENAFAASVIRHQEERHQIVVDTGLYGTLRHPMYAGGALVIFGIPLWLESYLGVLIAAAVVALLVARIYLEEQFLRRELAGYEAYAGKVRYRLIPHLW